MILRTFPGAHAGELPKNVTAGTRTRRRPPNRTREKLT